MLNPMDLVPMELKQLGKVRENTLDGTQSTLHTLVYTQDQIYG